MAQPGDLKTVQLLAFCLRSSTTIDVEVEGHGLPYDSNWYKPQSKAEKQ
jgi:hypothetical protein